MLYGGNVGNYHIKLKKNGKNEIIPEKLRTHLWFITSKHVLCYGEEKDKERKIICGFCLILLVDLV